MPPRPPPPGRRPRPAAPVAPPPDILAGLANHPRYRIVRKLGEGGMGAVYLAEHRVMRQPRAIKVISKAMLDAPGALDRFQAEVRAAARLSHHNIAQAYDAEQAGGLHFLVMEYVEGVSLADALAQRGPFPVVEACNYVHQAALGLQHAFEKGMVHRDVKPQNLMLTPDGRVKVLDFGLARMGSGRSRGLTGSGAFLGTPEYVAPEQAEDPRAADTRSDVYSLGCTLYALLAGQPPFPEDTPVKMILAHIEKEPAPLHRLRPDVPGELWAVVSKMLAKDPRGRYQAPIEAARALAPFARLPSKARPSVFARTPPARGSSTAGAVAALDARHLPPAPEKPAPSRARRATASPPAAPLAALGTKGIRESAGQPSGRAGSPAGNKLWPGLIAGAVSMLVLILVAGSLWLSQRGTVPDDRRSAAAAPTRKVEAAPVPAAVSEVIAPIAREPARVPVPDQESGAEPGRRAAPAPESKPAGQVVNREPKDFSNFHPAEPQPDSTSGLIWKVNKYSGGGSIENPGGPVTFSPDGTRCAWSYGGSTFNNSPVSFDVFIFDLINRKELHRLRGHANCVTVLAFSPDGRRLLTGGADHYLLLWDAEGGTLLGRLEGHQATVVGISISSDGQRAVSISKPGRTAEGPPEYTMRLWDISSRRELHRFGGYTESVQCASFIAGGRFMVSSCLGKTYLWDAETGKQERQLPFTRTQGTLMDIAFSPDGRYAAAGDAYVHIWCVADGTEVYRSRSAESRWGFHGVTFSSDGRRLLASRDGGEVHVWEVKTGQELCVLKNQTVIFSGTAAISPDGRQVLCNGSSLSLWRVPDGR